MPVTSVPPWFQREVPATSRADEEPRAPSQTAAPIRKHKFPSPKLRLQLNDLAHEGSSIFLSNIKASEDIETQVQNVLNLLYLPDSARPGTRSVTFILRAMDGVAYTTGTDLDNDHKEIHVSLGYISSVRLSPPRDEILGVICHELVHCFQWAANGTPGGLVEGIADWVRLRAGLGAKHWRQEAGGRWDGGYQHTAYFLEYLEQRFGDGTVRAINQCLRGKKYNEDTVFAQCCAGHKVEELWEDYKKQLEQGGNSEVAAQHSESKPERSGAGSNDTNDLDDETRSDVSKGKKPEEWTA